MYRYTGDAILRMLTTIVTTGGLASHNSAYDQRRSISCRTAPRRCPKKSPETARGSRWWTAAPHVRRRWVWCA